MRLRLSLAVLILSFGFSLTFEAVAQNDSDWHISPTEMNIRVGEPRPLQLLDVQGNEYRADSWTVDISDLAEVTVEDGRPVLIPKAAGKVVVFASFEGTTRSREIRIWPEGSKLRGVRWSVPPLGRETANLQAAPTATGPDLFSLDETDRGTYVRAFTHEGIQLWFWKVPDSGTKVEFVCGDNLGGAILAAMRSDSYTLYTVSEGGKLLWQRKLEGVKKGHALNYDNLLHVIDQPVDGTWARITAIDGKTGVERFTLNIPSSSENEVNITRTGDKIICSSGPPVSHALRTLTSGLFVNTDGFAYAAFTVDNWTLGTDKCTNSSTVDPKHIYLSRDDRLMLWQIHDDGSLKTTVVDELKQQRGSFAAPMTVMSPTGDIIPDGFGGVLLSVRWTHTDVPQKIRSLPDEFVYRITQEGDVAYKFPLPKYDGPLHDEMVLGEKDLGFATRGGMLIAFDVKDGNEVWRWDSGNSEITINMATAGGGCAVDTPEGLVLVEDGVKKRVVAPAGSQMYTPGEYIHTAR